MLIIRDGWGINPGGQSRARKQRRRDVARAHAVSRPALSLIIHARRLSASGMDVGLPEGQMGNSEVGHLNLGAGRIVYQDLTRINKAIADGELQTNRGLQETFARRGEIGCIFMGLVSDGGVHSHYSASWSRWRTPRMRRVSSDILIHAFTDGRDTSPTGGADYLTICERGTVSRAGRRSSLSSGAISRWIATGAGTARSWPGTRSCSGAAKSANDAPSAAVAHNMQPARQTNSCRR